MQRFTKTELEHAEDEVFEDLHDQRLRKVIGSFGGKPTKKDKLMNIFFLACVIVAFFIEILWHGTLAGRFALDIAILMISLKLIYLMHSQARINHYQFWILTAIEMKTTMMMEQLQKIESLKHNSTSKEDS